jgi:AcrR family transcriptional regulator
MMIMDVKQQTRQKILDAAENRFKRYGFNKTTMTEIANDCDMSAANIYRFFNSKSEIVGEMANAYYNQSEALLREVAHRPDLTVNERLEAFTLKALQCTYDLIGNQPKMKEIVEFITDERCDIITQHETVKRSLIAEILAEGNRTGAFDVQNIVTTADAFLHATVLFYCPYLMEWHSLEELEILVKEIVCLLVKGLEKR